MDMSHLRDKLEKLQVLVIDAYIEGIETGELHARDMAPVITLLNQNKVVLEDKPKDTTHQKVKRIMKKKEE